MDDLNFEDGETVRNTRAICATHSTIAKFSLYILQISDEFFFLIKQIIQFLGKQYIRSGSFDNK
jgi:hypothetical protein